MTESNKVGMRNRYILPTPQLNYGIVEFPVHHMRGGTSTGLVLWDENLPESLELREELLRHLMGVPLSRTLKGNKQITGLGRGSPTSNKVFIVKENMTEAGTVLESTLAQLAADHSSIDWSVNCGNMSAALPLWAADIGMLQTYAGQQSELTIYNTNTQGTSIGRVSVTAHGFEMTEIPGVEGSFPSVDLFVLNPVGAKTGLLLPTGRAIDEILGYSVSCVDVAVPMVIANASEFGKTGSETPAELEADDEFIANFHEVWVAAGLKMGLRKRDGTLMSEADIRKSETIPKACIVSAPQSGGSINVRYFTPQQAHASMAVSGACCLAAATLIPGSVAQRIAIGVPEASPRGSEVVVGIENPAGILEATVAASSEDGPLTISKAAYRRSAQILARGHVPLYQASNSLRDALIERLSSLSLVTRRD